MRNTRQEHSEKLTLPLLFMLTRRMILFLFLLMTGLICFYLIGNYQQFLDSSQKIILNACAITAVGEILFSLMGTVESILCLVLRKDARLYHSIHLVLIVISGLYGTAFLILFRVISIISTGL